VSVALVAAAALLLSSPQAGHWSGRLEGSSKAAKVSFDVARDGRHIKRFRTTVAAFCVGPTIGTNHIAILVVAVPTTKIHADGRFKKAYKTDGGTYRISGTLKGNRVRNGIVDVDVSTCGGRDKWTARRASR
jgi:hypothetical protein